MTWLDEKDQTQVEEMLARFRAPEFDQGYVEDCAGGDERFALWLRLVDKRMIGSVGVSHRDIADWTWRDAYDGGQSPSSAALDALSEDDTYAVMFAGLGD
jgi:hypothetical protein